MPAVRSEIFTAHPFLRDWFRQLLGAGATSVHQAIRTAIAPTLEARPARPATDTELLDRYEALIEHTRLAGAELEAFDLYWFGLGAHEHLGKRLGENTRGVRIMAAFSSSGLPEDVVPTLALRDRAVLLAEWGLHLKDLGQLEHAAHIFKIAERWVRQLEDPGDLSDSLLNAAEVAFLRGRLPEARSRSGEALAQAGIAKDKLKPGYSHALPGYRTSRAWCDRRSKGGLRCGGSPDGFAAPFRCRCLAGSTSARPRLARCRTPSVRGQLGESSAQQLQPRRVSLSRPPGSRRCAAVARGDRAPSGRDAELDREKR